MPEVAVQRVWEEVGIKGGLVGLRAAALLRGCIVREVTVRNFAPMCDFTPLFVDTSRRWARGAQGSKAAGLPSVLLLESGVHTPLHLLCPGGCAKVFVLLIIIFVATGNRKGMQTVHWRKGN